MLQVLPLLYLSEYQHFAGANPLVFSATEVLLENILTFHPWDACFFENGGDFLQKVAAIFQKVDPVFLVAFPVALR